MAERRSREDVSSYQAFIAKALAHKRIGQVGGRPVFIIAGGSEGAPEGGGSAGEGEGDGGGGAGSEGEGGEGEGSGKPSGEGEGEKPPAQRKESKDDGPRPGEDRGAYRARRARQEAIDRAERAERALEDLQDRDRTETEKLKKRGDKAEARVAVLEPTTRRLAIENAFLKASFGTEKRKPIPWIDAGDVLLLVTKELDGIKIGDDGEIDEDDVRSIVDDIAKRKPHLIRKEKKEPAEQQPSGGPVGSQGQQTKEQASYEELARRFPAMRQRAPRQ
jgi:hypothetical protein